MVKPMSGTRTDSIAIGLSGLCLIHCLALPLLAVSMPVMGVVAEAEWLHQIFVIAAFCVVVFALFNTQKPSTRAVFAVLAVTGLGFLIAGAFAEAFHNYEVTLTVLGALILAVAHIYRWRTRHQTHAFNS
jgi:hypothetical protein